MIEILKELQEYVPTSTTTKDVPVKDSPTPRQVHVDKFHQLLLGKKKVRQSLAIYDNHDDTLQGGDQLTASRIRSGKRIKRNSVRGKERLEGFVPASEDWHAKMCLLGVRLLIFCAER